MTIRPDVCAMAFCHTLRLYAPIDVISPTLFLNHNSFSYLNGFGFDFLEGEQPRPGIIALVTPRRLGLPGRW
jgi:hypothetical protein